MNARCIVNEDVEVVIDGERLRIPAGCHVIDERIAERARAAFPELVDVQIIPQEPEEPPAAPATPLTPEQLDAAADADLAEHLKEQAAKKERKPRAPRKPNGAGK